LEFVRLIPLPVTSSSTAEFVDLIVLGGGGAFAAANVKREGESKIEDNTQMDLKLRDW
jgi:hypothetical protein